MTRPILAILLMITLLPLAAAASDGVPKRSVVITGLDIDSMRVRLDEIDMQNMRAKRFEGLYVIGEALDADGITGGYNLQLCWSTAGTAADDLKSLNKEA